MCTHYAPIPRQLLRAVFGSEPPPQDWKSEIWPDDAAPIVRANGAGQRDSVLASFGMVRKRGFSRAARSSIRRTPGRRRSARNAHTPKRGNGALCAWCQRTD